MEPLIISMDINKSKLLTKKVVILVFCHKIKIIILTRKVMEEICLMKQITKLRMIGIRNLQ